MPLLDRAIRSLNPHAKYRSDLRLLDVWVEAASVRTDNFARVLFFETAFHRGIGVDHALLYEKWGLALEASGDVDSARSVFQMGYKKSFNL